MTYFQLNSRILLWHLLMTVLPSSKHSLTGCHDCSHHLKRQSHVWILRQLFQLRTGNNKALDDSEIAYSQRNDQQTVFWRQIYQYHLAWLTFDDAPITGLNETRGPCSFYNDSSYDLLADQFPWYDWHSDVEDLYSLCSKVVCIHFYYNRNKCYSYDCENVMKNYQNVAGSSLITCPSSSLLTFLTFIQIVFLWSKSTYRFIFASGSVR